MVASGLHEIVVAFGLQSVRRTQSNAVIDIGIMGWIEAYPLPGRLSLPGSVTSAQHQ